MMATTAALVNLFQKTINVDSTVSQKFPEKKQLNLMKNIVFGSKDIVYFIKKT